MSDPVTNAEIEDVLSSIRRLVSTDEREKSAAPKAVPDEQDKLVLTPSQRVDDAPEDDDAEDVGATGPAPGEAVFLAQYAVEPDAESEASEHDAEMKEDAAKHAESDSSGDQDEAPEPEFSHHEENHFFKASHCGAENGNAPEADSEPESSESPVQDAVADVTEEDDRDTANGTDQATFEAEEAEEAIALKDDGPDLQARIASVEAALAGRDDEWEPDGDDDDPYSGDQMTTLEWEDHASDESEEGETGQDAKPAAFEAASDEGFEPETEGLADDFAPSATERDDHLERPEDTAPGSEDATDDWQLESDVLDEDALRDMVSEIVRQELQGALGERITRNVRKLVRREIHRALASQDFE
ncbi:hypothetical protein [uncultured Roseovarius sp.]|uniref:hypothetical protein n=1 Tax=uncultured Roseovarius sp. TaxID=293344 RepID=UPI002600ECBC|nr:hypothetical protein [uncultured Roseovarius sp.]